MKIFHSFAPENAKTNLCVFTYKMLCWKRGKPKTFFYKILLLYSSQMDKFFPHGWRDHTQCNLSVTPMSTDTYLYILRDLKEHLFHMIPLDGLFWLFKQSTMSIYCNHPGRLLKIPQIFTGNICSRVPLEFNPFLCCSQ